MVVLSGAAASTNFSVGYLTETLNCFSSLKHEKVVADLLVKCKPMLVQGISYYKQKDNAVQRLKDLNSDGVGPPLLNFVERAYQWLKLDPVICYDLLCDYFSREYCGQERDVEVLLASDERSTLLLNALDAFYRREQLNVYRCLSAILKHFLDSNHPYEAVLHDFVDKHLRAEQFMNNLYEQLEDICAVSVTDLPQDAKTSRNHVEWAEFFVQLQLEISYVALCHFRVLEHDGNELIKWISFFKKIDFGRKQLNRAHLKSASNRLLVALGNIQTLFVLQSLELEWMLFHVLYSVGETKVDDHALLRTDGVQTKMDRLVEGLCSCYEHSAIFLGWATFLQMAQQLDAVTVDPARLQKLCACAKLHNAVGFLNEMMMSSYFAADKILLKWVASVAYSIVDALLCSYEAESLGDQSELHNLIAVLLRQEHIAEDFWNKGFANGVAELFREFLFRFPSSIGQLLPLCTALASSSAANSAKVVSMLQRLPYYTESLDCLSTGEIRMADEAGDVNVVLQNARKPYAKGDILLPVGTVGELVDADSTWNGGLVQWHCFQNGWQVCLAELQMLLGQISAATCTNARHILSLVAALVRKDPAHSAQQFVHFLQVAVEFLRQYSFIHSEALESDLYQVLTVAVDVIAEAALAYPGELANQLLPVGLFPRSSNPRSGLDNLLRTIEPRWFGHMIQEKECIVGDYKLTKVYLKLIVNLSASEVCLKHAFVLDNVCFVLSSLFPVYAGWQYLDLGDKHTLGELLLRLISYLVRSRPLALIDADSDTVASNKPPMTMADASWLCEHLLLTTEICEPLLVFLALGPERLQAAIDASAGYAESVAEHPLVRQLMLAFSITMRLLDSAKYGTQLAVFAGRLCAPPLSGDRGKPVLANIARCLFFRADERVAKLALLCVTKVAALCPSVLFSCLGDDRFAVCDALILRLELYDVDVQMKIDSIRFVAACVEHQPGVAEMLLGVQSVNGVLDISKSSCLVPIWNIVAQFSGSSQAGDTVLAYPADLLQSCLGLFDTLWRLNHTLAIRWLRQREHFYAKLVLPLMMDIESFSDALAVPILNILARELLILPSMSRTDDPLRELDLLCKALVIEQQFAVMFDCMEQCAKADERLLTFLKAWSAFTFVMVVRKASIVPKSVQQILVTRTLRLVELTLATDWSRGQKCAVLLTEVLALVIRQWPGCIVAAARASMVERLANALQIPLENIQRSSLKLIINLAGTLSLMLGEHGDDVPDERIMRNVLSISCALYDSCLLVYLDRRADLPEKMAKMLMQVMTAAVRIMIEMVSGGAFSGELLRVLRERATLRNIVLLLEKLGDTVFDVNAQLLSMVVVLFRELSNDEHSLELIESSGMIDWINLHAVALFERGANVTANALRALDKLALLCCDMLRGFEHRVLGSSLAIAECYCGLFTKVLRHCCDGAATLQWHQAAESVLLFLCTLAEYRPSWNLRIKRSCIQQFLLSVGAYAQHLISALSHPGVLHSHRTGDVTTAVTATVSTSSTVSPLAGPEAQTFMLHKSWLNGLVLSLHFLKRFMPDLSDACNDPNFDCNAFQRLVAVSAVDDRWHEAVLPASSLVACLQLCYAWLRKADVAPRSTSPRKASSAISAALSWSPQSIDKNVVGHLFEYCAHILLTNTVLRLRYEDRDSQEELQWRRDVLGELVPLLSRCVKTGTPSPSTARRSPTVHHSPAIQVLDQPLLKTFIVVAQALNAST